MSKKKTFKELRQRYIRRKISQLEKRIKTDCWQHERDTDPLEYRLIEEISYLEDRYEELYGH